MSEYCILENNPHIQGAGRDLGMDPALYLARVIHADLTIANASSWQWWLAVSPYDYKDGLVYIDHHKNDGHIYESKMLWSLGHYSRFIRPGAQRIETWRSDNKTIAQTFEGLLVSGFQNESGDFVAVLVNQEQRNIPIHLEVPDFEITKIEGYRTTVIEDENMFFFKVNHRDNQIIEIPAKSIVTLVVK
jgi:hypothetical protein